MSTDGSAAPASVTGTLAVAVAPCRTRPFSPSRRLSGPRTPRSPIEIAATSRAIPRKRCPSDLRGTSGQRSCGGADQGGGDVGILTPEQLAGLAVTPPADFDGGFTLAVTAISTRRHGGAGEHDPDRPGVGRSRLGRADPSRCGRRRHRRHGRSTRYRGSDHGSVRSAGGDDLRHARRGNAVGRNSQFRRNLDAHPRAIGGNSRSRRRAIPTRTLR